MEFSHGHHRSTTREIISMSDRCIVPMSLQMPPSNPLTHNQSKPIETVAD
jgi:hypothetical protein